MTAAFGTEEFAANLALGHLGQPEIAAMSDSTTRARKVRQFFPVARDAMLRHKPWNFATAWISPAADPVQGLGDLKLRYPLPVDCLRVRYIKGDNRRDWAIESSVASVGGVAVETSILVTNIVSPTVCYTRQIAAVRLWDSMFLDAFGYMLASYLATALGRSQSTADDMKAKALSATVDAAGIDGKERGGEQCRPEPSWARSRRGYGASGRYLRS